MTLNANNIKATSSNKPRVKQAEIPVGNYMARLVQVVDTGVKFKDKWDTATNSYVPDREAGMKQHIMLTYELLTEFVKDEEGVEQEDKPRWISEEWPLYNLQQDRATTTKRYNAFDPSVEFDGDWTKLVGMPCQVAIVHKRSGKAKVGSVASAIKGIPYPELKNEPKIYTIDMGDNNILQSLPEWVQEKIKGASNFPAGAGTVEPQATNAQSTTSSVESGESSTPTASAYPTSSSDDNNPY